jgi:hypothetical protein
MASPPIPTPTVYSDPDWGSYWVDSRGFPVPGIPQVLFAGGNINWEGSPGTPIYMKQPDGSWKNIGSPEHAESSYYVQRALQDPQLEKLITLRNSAPELLNNEQKAFFAGGAGSLDSLGQGYRWSPQNLFDNKFDPQQAGFLLQTGYSKYLSPTDIASGTQFNQYESAAAQSARAEANKGITGLGTLGDIAVLGGLAAFGIPAIGGALGTAGAAGTAGALEGLTAADIMAGMDLAGTAAGAELGIGSTGFLGDVLTAPSMIDQSLLDQVGGGLSSGESAGVTTSPFADIGQPTISTIPETTTGSLSGSTGTASSLGGLTDADIMSGMDLAGTPAGADLGIGSTGYLGDASQALTNATNVDLAGVGQQGWESLPGETLYGDISAPSMIDQSAIDAAQSATTPSGLEYVDPSIGQVSPVEQAQASIPSSGGIDFSNLDVNPVGDQISAPSMIDQSAIDAAEKATPSSGLSLADIQKYYSDVKKIKSIFDLLTEQTTAQSEAIKNLQNKNIIDGGASALSSYNAITNQQNKYDDPTRRSFLSPSMISTGSPLQNIALPGVDPRLMAQLLSRGYQVNAATGGEINPARLVPGPEGRYYAKHQQRGFSVGGPGTGQSDDIPTMLSDGEYVIDADTVAALGDGSSKAGASVLDKFRQEIRKHKRSASLNDIPPKAKSPMQYLQMAQKGKHHG